MSTHDYNGDSAYSGSDCATYTERSRCRTGTSGAALGTGQSPESLRYKGCLTAFPGHRVVSALPRLTKRQWPSDTIESSWMSWLPWLLFGGFGSLFVFVSIVGLVTLWRRRSEPTPQLVQQTLVLVAAGAMSVTEGTRRLTGHTTTSSETKSPSVAGRLVVGALLIALIYFSLQSMGKSWRLLVHGFRTDGKVVALVHNAKKAVSHPWFAIQSMGNPMN